MSDKKKNKNNNAESGSDFLNGETVTEYVRSVTVDVMNLMNKRMSEDIGTPLAPIGARIAGLSAILCLIIARSDEDDFDVFCDDQKELFAYIVKSKFYREYQEGLVGDIEDDFKIEDVVSKSPEIGSKEWSEKLFELFKSKTIH